MPKRCYSPEEKQEAMRNRMNSKKPEQKEFVSKGPTIGPKPREIRTSRDRIYFDHHEIELMIIEPDRFLCDLGIDLLNKWGPWKKRMEFPTPAQIELRREIDNFKKMNFSPHEIPTEENIHKLNQLIGQFGIRTRLTGVPNPFISHLEYCMNCRDKIRKVEAERQLKRNDELIAVLNERCIITSRVFDDREIEFMEAISSNPHGWNVSVGGKLLKFFECKNKQELIFVYRHWKNGFEARYGKLEIFGVRIDDLRRNS